MIKICTKICISNIILYYYVPVTTHYIKVGLADYIPTSKISKPNLNKFHLTSFHCTIHNMSMVFGI